MRNSQDGKLLTFEIAKRGQEFEIHFNNQEIDQLIDCLVKLKNLRAAQTHDHLCHPATLAPNLAKLRKGLRTNFST